MHCPLVHASAKELQSACTLHLEHSAPPTAPLICVPSVLVSAPWITPSALARLATPQPIASQNGSLGVMVIMSLSRLAILVSASEMLVRSVIGSTSKLT